eukprot:1157545-Pelagomonas_calceolata.AAC.5
MKVAFNSHSSIERGVQFEALRWPSGQWRRLQCPISRKRAALRMAHGIRRRGRSGTLRRPSGLST